MIVLFSLVGLAAVVVGLAVTLPVRLVQRVLASDAVFMVKTVGASTLAGFVWAQVEWFMRVDVHV